MLLPPIFIGFAIFFLIFSTGGIYPFSTGACGNPARALGPAIASGKLDKVWVYVIAPICAATVHAFIYNLIPPKFYEKNFKKNNQLTKID